VTRGICLPHLGRCTWLRHCVVTETVPAQDAHCMSWAPEPPLRQDLPFAGSRPGGASLSPLSAWLSAGRHPSRRSAGGSTVLRLQGWATLCRPTILCTVPAGAEPAGDRRAIRCFGLGAARYDPEAKVVAVGHTTGYTSGALAGGCSIGNAATPAWSCGRRCKR